jgi:methionyl-tRNA formyltransferase
MLRIVYFGTPEFAEPSLRSLAADSSFEVALVVSQPDRKAGRGQRLESPPVAVAAHELGLPLYQPETFRTPESRRPLVQADADLFVVAAFGLVFGAKTLAIPRLGCVNLHASLLPAYRGSSPIQTAIAMGEPETGVTLMKMDRGLDTGDMISRVVEPIRQDDTTASLSKRLAVAGAALALRDLTRFASGELVAVPQPSGATVTRLIRKSDGWLDWRSPASELERRVRAFWPWPRAWTTCDSQQVQIHAATVVDAAGSPGQIVSRRGSLVVACGDKGLRLDRVLPAGRKPMAGPEWATTLDECAMLGITGDPGPRPPLVELATDDEGD